MGFEVGVADLWYFHTVRIDDALHISALSCIVATLKDLD